MMQGYLLPNLKNKYVFCHGDIPSLLTKSHYYHEKERLAAPDRQQPSSTAIPARRTCEGPDRNRDGYLTSSR